MSHGHLIGDAQLSPDISARAYFNHAALSPPSPPVLAAVTRCLRAFAERGSDAFMGLIAEREELKRGLAQLFGLGPERAVDFALAPNTTSALQAIAHAIPWRAQERLLLFKGEFPTNITPWRQAAERHELELCWASLEPLASPQGADWSEVEAQLKRGVRLVCVSAVQFQTGLRVPLEELAERCERYGAELCVDGIQACGISAIPLDRVHYLGTGGHKWMMAVEGAGFMYVRPDAMARLRPQSAGWLSLSDPLDFLFDPSAPLAYERLVRPEASAFEGGAQASLCYAALGAAVQLLNGVYDEAGRRGVEAISTQVHQLNDRLEEGLIELGFKSLRCPDRARQSGILSLIPPAEMGGVSAIPSIAARWAERGFVCATPNACLRISPHWYNSLEQVDFALEVARSSR